MKQRWSTSTMHIKGVVPTFQILCIRKFILLTLNLLHPRVQVPWRLSLQHVVPCWGWGAQRRPYMHHQWSPPCIHRSPGWSCQIKCTGRWGTGPPVRERGMDMTAYCISWTCPHFLIWFFAIFNKLTTNLPQSFSLQANTVISSANWPYVLDLSHSSFILQLMTLNRLPAFNPHLSQHKRNCDNSN